MCDLKQLTQRRFASAIVSLHWNVQELSLQLKWKKLSQTLLPEDFEIEFALRFLERSARSVQENCHKTS